VLYYKIGISLESNGGSNLSNIEKTRTTVDIYGQQYIILGTEAQNHVQHVASLVDKKMREIGSRNPLLDVNKLAVLTAVNAVNDYIKMKEQLERMQAELKKEKD
jgi:cell division protein ZapA